MANTIQEWTYDGAKLNRRGRASYGGQLFTLGITEPTRNNTGAGIIADYPTTVVEGNVTVATGQILENKIINGFVTVTGTGLVRNCVVRGPAAPYVTTNNSLIVTTNATWTSEPNVLFTTVDPQTPTPFLNGIGNSNYYVYRCQVIRCTDAMTVAGGAAKAYVTHTRGEGNFLGFNIPWIPDIANTGTYPGGRPEGTHSDVIQFHGNKADVTDSVWIGNTISSRHDRTYSGSVTKSGVGTAVTWPADAATTEINHNGVVLSTPVTDTCYGYFEKNWFYGGIVPFNGGGGTSGAMTVIDNLFERRNSAYDAPSRELVINAVNYTRVTTPANYYMGDVGRIGATVPVGNS